MIFLMLRKEKMYKTELNKESSLSTALVFSFVYAVLVFFIALFFPTHEMTIAFYMGVVYIAVVFSTISQHPLMNSQRHPNFFLVFSFFSLFFVLAFRNGNAIDDGSYTIIFNQTKLYGITKTFFLGYNELGYLALMRLISLFTDDYLWVQIVTAAIPLMILCCGLIKFGEKVHCGVYILMLSTCFFFQMVSINLSRMFFALAITSIAVFYIADNKNIKGILLIISASFFHYSSLIMLLAIVIAKTVKYNRFSKLKSTFFIVLTPLLITLISNMGRVFLSKYSNYNALSFNPAEIVGGLSRIPLLAIILYFKQYVHNQEKKQYIEILEYIYIIGVMIKICSVFSTPPRLIYYFDFASFICVSALYKGIHDWDKKNILLLILTVYGGLFLLRTQFLNSQQNSVLFPYNGIFFNLE